MSSYYLPLSEPADATLQIAARMIVETARRLFDEREVIAFVALFLFSAANLI